MTPGETPSAPAFPLTHRPLGIFAGLSSLTRLNRGLFGLLVLILAAIPAAILSVRHTTNAFLYFTFANAQVSMDLGHLAEGDFELSSQFSRGYSLLLIAIMQATGLPPLAIRYLPAGALLIAVASYTFMRRWSGSGLLAALVMLFFAFDPSLGVGNYSVFAYAWGMPMYVTFLLALLGWLNGGRAYALVLVLLFCGMTLIHYTPPIWMLIASGIGVVYVALRRWITSSDRALRLDRAPFVIGLAAFYLTFNQLFFAVVLPQEGENLLGETYGLFARKISLLLGFATAEQSDLFYVGANYLPLNATTVAQYALFLGLAGVAIVLSLRRRYAGRAWVFFPWFLLAVVGLTTLFDAVAYSTRGIVSFKYALLAFPLLVPLALATTGTRSSGHSIAALGLVALVTLAGAEFAFTLSAPDLPPELVPENDYDVTASGTSWLAANSAEDARVIADLHTIGHVLYAGAVQHHPFRSLYFDVPVYSALVEPSIHSADVLSTTDYIVLNQRALDEPIVSAFWRSFQPLEGSMPAVHHNHGVAEIYDDGRVLVLATRSTTDRVA